MAWEVFLVRLRWVLALALMMPLSGCIGDGSSFDASGAPAVAARPITDRDAAGGTTPVPVAKAPEPRTQEPRTQESPMEELAAAPWHEVADVSRLADCGILYNLVSAGIPEAQLPGHVSISLTDADGAAYDVYLAAADGSHLTAPALATELCIGFTRDDRRIGYSDVTSGMVPAGADRMFIAGDLLTSVDVRVVLHDVEPGFDGAWTPGPWPLIEEEPRESILIA